MRLVAVPYNRTARFAHPPLTADDTPQCLEDLSEAPGTDVLQAAGIIASWFGFSCLATPTARPSAWRQKNSLSRT
jgi:hypothetical protein